MDDLGGKNPYPNFVSERREISADASKSADSRIPIWFVEKDSVVYIIYQSERGVFSFRDESNSVFHRSAAPSVQRTRFFWDGHFGLGGMFPQKQLQLGTLSVSAGYV